MIKIAPVRPNRTGRMALIVMAMAMAAAAIGMPTAAMARQRESKPSHDERESQRESQRSAQRADDGARQRATDAARQQAASAARQQAASAARQRASDEARQRAGDQARQRDSEAARQQAVEAAARQRAGEESRRRIDDDARRQAIEQARQQAVEQTWQRGAAQVRNPAVDRARELAAEQERRRATELARQREADLTRQRDQANRDRSLAQTPGRRDGGAYDGDRGGRDGDRFSDRGDRGDDNRSRIVTGTTNVTRVDRTPVHNDNTAIHYGHKPVHNDNTAVHADHDALIAQARDRNRGSAPQAYRAPDRSRGYDGHRGNDRDRDRYRNRRDHDGHGSHFSLSFFFGSGWYGSTGYLPYGVYADRHFCAHGRYYDLCPICATHYPYSYHTYYDHVYDPVYDPNTAVLVVPPEPVVIEQTTVYEPAPLPDPQVRLPDGWPLIRAKDPAGARRAFEDLINADPNEGLHRIGYAIASALLEDDEAAAVAMRDAVASDPASMITMPRDHVIQLYVRSLIDRYQVRADTAAARADDAFMVAALAYLDQQFPLASASARLAIAAGDEDPTTIQLRDMITYQLHYQRDAANE